MNRLARITRFSLSGFGASGFLFAGLRGRLPATGRIRMYPRCTQALGLMALMAVFPVASASPETETIRVTATRFSDPPPGAIANISVISQQDILNTPAQSLPDVLASRAGIHVAALGGALGRNATVDLRGFGATATGNTLILVDGQRINPVDSGSIVWSAIPLESVDRIEVARGSGSVLYGDGATGGVINIITKKSGKPLAAASATLGTWGYKGGSVQLSNGNDRGYFNLIFNHADAEGYRKNGQQDQDTASGRIGWLLDHGEVFADVATYRESAGQPGSVFSAAYRHDPRSTRYPLNTEAREGYRLRPGFTFRLNERITLEGETTLEQQTLISKYHSPFAATASHRVRETVSLTPRLRWRHGLFALPGEMVLGFDYHDGKVDSDNSGFANQGARQQSSAIYMQNISRLLPCSPNLSLTLGARTQRLRQQAHQDAYTGGWPSPEMSGEKVRRLQAHDAGLSYTEENWHLYGKTGSTFRFANLDELFGFDAFFNPVFVGDLKPQHGRLAETGGGIAFGALRLRAALYRLNLQDEIGYDGSLGANTNFSPTRRTGGEIEADWKISSRFMVKAAYARTNAQFRSGPYAGNTLPLVPLHQSGVRLIWSAGQAGTYTAAFRHIGSRRFDSDFDNTHEHLPAVTTLDLQSVWDAKPWKVTARLINALDRKYAASGGYAPAYGDHYYYPADGRSFFVSVRHDL